MSQIGQKKMTTPVVRQLKTVPLISLMPAPPQIKPGSVTGNPAQSAGGQGQQQPWVRQTPDQIPVKRTMAKTTLTKRQQHDLKRLQAWQEKVSLRQIKTVSPTTPTTQKKKATPQIQSAEVRTYYKNLRNEQRAMKKAMKQKNKQANANVVPMTRYFQDPQPNEPDAMTSDMAPNMAWQEIEKPIPQLTNRQRKALYRLKLQEWKEKHLGSIPMPTSQYQAPHQNEPDDLTDDLAPSMAPNTAVKQQPGVQTGNKLNFKFQKPVQKTPDWSEYQNKFRQIGGGSPEPDGPPDNVKEEPVGNQSADTGFIFEEDVEMREVPVHHIDSWDLNVAVTTEPYLHLNEDQVKEIDEALVNKIQDAIFHRHLSHIPTFEDIPVHNLGHLPLKCQGVKDLVWLHEILPTIRSPIPDVNLAIKPQTDIPNLVKVKLFVPNFSGTLDELQHLLHRQNLWYNMNSWMLVKSEKQGDDPSNYTLEYRVPEIQALIIDNRDRRVAYSLSSILAVISDDDTIDTEKVFKYRNVAPHLQVCVLTDPFRYLTLLEVELIRLALVYKLEKDVHSDKDNYIPAFRGCPSHYKGGLKVWCESDRDLKWLKEAVTAIVSPAIGTKLAVKTQAAVPPRAKMTVSIPTNENEAFILKVIKSQNPWLDVESWTLFSSQLDPGAAAAAPAPATASAPAPAPAPAPALAAALAPAPAENNITLVGKQPRKKKPGVVQVDVRFPRAEPPQPAPAPPHAQPAPAQPHAQPTHGSYKTPFEYAFDYTPAPAGIPRSFLRQQEPQMIQEPIPPPMQHIPNPAELAYQAQTAVYSDLPSWILPAAAPQLIQANQAVYENVQPTVGNAQVLPPMYRQQEPVPDRPYSPSEAYSENVRAEEDPHEGSESPDLLQGQKRQSAFSRLGPLTQPKKPKLTINLMLNKEQAVREVVDETDALSRYVPVHMRKDILQSEDELVKKYLPFWPWKKNIKLRKTVSARHSKTVMLWEQEQMEGGYEKENQFIQVVVRGYPNTWKKESVLDAVLECVKGKTFIPLFTEFTPQECKFLVIRCHAALLAIHKVGFYIRSNDVELTVSISLTDTGLNQIDLIPRIVLRKSLMLLYDGESKLDLTEFMAKTDVSHFVYFPLNRVTNQIELLQLQSDVAWEYLTELNLSRNRLSSLDGLNLRKSTPRLKRLDLSHNCLDKLTCLLPLRELPLKALRLEGNPLCHDYIDSAHYVKVVRMMFHEIRQLDGVEITLKGDLPLMKRNYCPWGAAAVVEKFLETFFPLLEAPHDERAAIEDLYDKDAVMTITFRHKLRYGTLYRYFRNLFIRARSLEEREMESIVGAGSIATLVGKWPAIQHDRYTITVDVLHHDDSTTILRLGGVLKLTAETLAEDEHLLTFGRTVVLHTRTGAEYRIRHEMLYWDVPREEQVTTAFNITTVRPRQLTLKLESPPDDDLKSKLVDIFVKLADIDRKRGARCLELKNWDLRSALEYYVSLLKLDDLTILSSGAKDRTPAPLAS